MDLFKATVMSQELSQWFHPYLGKISKWVETTNQKSTVFSISPDGPNVAASSDCMDCFLLDFVGGRSNLSWSIFGNYIIIHNVSPFKSGGFFEGSFPKAKPCSVSLGIQSPKLRMVMEPTYLAFRR